MALKAVDHLARLDRAAVPQGRRVHQVGAAREDVGLERHIEPPAVADHVDMAVRNAAGTGVEVETFIERRGLRRLVHFLHDIPTPKREAAPACPALRFEDYA